MNTNTVLHILWSGSIGGAQNAVYQLVQAQIQRSKFLPVVAFAKTQGVYFGKIKALGCEILDLNLSSDKYVHSLLRLQKVLRLYPIHHFHSAELTLTLSSILCKKARRVYTQRGGLMDYRGKQKLRYMLIGLLLRHFFHGYSGNTKHACISASKLFDISPDLWHVTYNGLDFDLLTPQRSKSEAADEISLPMDGRATIGTSAHLRGWKRIDLLLEACVKLPPESFRLIVLGDGPDRPRLESMTHALGISNRTIFTGVKERIGDYLPLLDIFVLPSMGLESFGNAAVEAMSQGIPTIVFNDGGGLLEHVKDTENGYVVSSVGELSTRLGTLINNRSLRSSLGTKAREYVTTHYTPQRMVVAYDSLYETALTRIQT